MLQPELQVVRSRSTSSHAVPRFRTPKIFGPPSSEATLSFSIFGAVVVAAVGQEDPKQRYGLKLTTQASVRVPAESSKTNRLWPAADVAREMTPSVPPVVTFV